MLGQIQSPEVIASLIGFIATVIAAFIAYRAALRSARMQSEKNKHPLSRANFMITLKAFSEISEHVLEVFKQTKADRYLILCAHNGTDQLRFASAIYEQIDDEKKDAKLSFGAVSKYVNFEFDAYYRKMLKEVEVEGSMVLDLTTMPECDLKYIYQNEKVNHSNVYFISRIKDYDSRGNDLLIYSTFATHAKEPFNDGELIRIRTAINNVKIILKSIITNQ